MMSQIYTNALKVVVWLGVETPHTIWAIKLLEEIIPYTYEIQFISNSEERKPDIAEKVDNWVFQPKTNNSEPVMSTPSKIIQAEARKGLPNSALAIHALSELLSRPYWERIWIIQEITKARKVEIRCGKFEINLDALLQALELVRNLSARSKSLLAAIATFRAQEQQNAGRRMPLFQAMLMSRFSLATEPRDKIYALLGLTSDGPDLLPTPTYTEDLETLFRRLTAEMIKSQNSFNVLPLARWVPLKDSRSSAPCWVVNWTDLDYLAPPWIAPSVHRDLDPMHPARIQVGSKVYSHGRLLGIVNSVEGEKRGKGMPQIMSYAESYFEKMRIYRSSVEVMQDICAGLLTRLAPDPQTTRLASRLGLLNALARMLRDAQKGWTSSEYNLSKVRDIFSRLCSLEVDENPVWEWARLYNYNNLKESPICPLLAEGNDFRRTMPMNASFSAFGVETDASMPITKPPILTSGGPSIQRFGRFVFGWKDRYGSNNQALPTSCGRSGLTAPTLSSMQKPKKEGCSDDTLDKKTQIPLVAFRVWEDVVSSLAQISEYDMRIAFAQDRSLIFVHPSAREGDLIYQLDMCDLPVILRKTYRQGEFYFVGEACLGRQENGDWRPAEEAILPALSPSGIHNSNQLMLGVELDRQAALDADLEFHS